MDKWQQQFCEKVKLVREASCDKFEGLATRGIDPLFEEFSAFLGNLDVHGTCPVRKSGLRTFRFSLSENAYLLLNFRLIGLEACEATWERCVPGSERAESHSRTEILAAADNRWCRGVFESALDHFLEEFLDAMTTAGAFAQ